MFQHLFAGSPAWLITIALAGVAIHIGGGGVGILSGAAALSVRKGERLHRFFGRLFVGAMLTMAVAAIILASVLVSRGRLSQWPNVIAGFFALYLVITAWATVKREAGTAGRFEVGAFLAAVALALLALLVMAPMVMSPAGRHSGVPVFAPFIFAGVAVLAAGADLRVILARGVSGVARITRHIWRMCLSLFIATGSFFIGQQQDMPASIQGSPVLLALGFAPLVVMACWLVWVRFAPAWRTPTIVLPASA